MVASLDTKEWAYELAEMRIGVLQPRWHHVRAVARLAEAAANAFDFQPRLLASAALLHDIGYSTDVAKTGFHPLDGARYLRKLGRDDLALLVAHHSGARHEAVLRGIEGYEGEFPYQDSPADHALTFCDMTTSPWGTRIRLHDRIAEIQARYGPEHTTAAAISGCAGELEHAVTETERRIAAAGIVLTGSLAYPD